MHKKIVNFVLCIVGSTLLFKAGEVDARCNTGSQGCSGRAVFENTKSEQNCLSIFFVSGGIRNMCIEPGGKGYQHVRYGDKVCWSDGNYAPKDDCSKKYLFTE